MAPLPEAVPTVGRAAGPAPPAVRPAPAFRRVRSRRRPAGAPPPLPRHLNASGKWWLALSGAVVVIWVVVWATGSVGLFDVADTWVLQHFQQIRTSALDQVAEVAGVLATRQAIYVLWLANLLPLILFRRWRHLFVTVVVGIIVVNIGASMAATLQ